MKINFHAAADHSYTIEYRDSLGSGAWQPLVNLGYFATATPVIYIASTAQPARYYRLNAY